MRVITTHEGILYLIALTDLTERVLIILQSPRIVKLPQAKVGEEADNADKERNFSFPQLGKNPLQNGYIKLPVIGNIKVRQSRGILTVEF
ncbi:MAG: hypothetical protein AAF208_04630 [Cyanobacteria bacterium P01_A01_bin.45]